MLSPVHLPFLRKACIVCCISGPPTWTTVQQTTALTRRGRNRPPIQLCAFELGGLTHTDQLPFFVLYILFTWRNQPSAFNDAIQAKVGKPSEIAVVLNVSLVDSLALIPMQGNGLRWGDGPKPKKVLGPVLERLSTKGIDLSPHRSRFCHVCSMRRSGLACRIKYITQIEFFWKVIRSSVVRRVGHLSASLIPPPPDWVNFENL
jgi:hypothetical protein